MYQVVRNVRGFFEKFDVLFPCYLRFEIRLFALLPTKYSYCQFIILFNYINDADNNTLYACNRNIENIMKDLSQNRSSHQRCSSKFRKIHRKTLVQESLFNKGCFPVNSAKLWRTLFLIEHPRRLLLKLSASSCYLQDFTISQNCKCNLPKHFSFLLCFMFGRECSKYFFAKEIQFINPFKINKGNFYRAINSWKQTFPATTGELKTCDLICWHEIICMSHSTFNIFPLKKYWSLIPPSMGDTTDKITPKPFI